MPMKREPDAFPAQGTGGARHRFDELSKADWADAYADLYRQCFGDTSTTEAILDDVEHRDDLRRLANGEKAKKRPTPATPEQRDYWERHGELWQAIARARRNPDPTDWENARNELAALEATHPGSPRRKA